jgi:hypothetical protein
MVKTFGFCLYGPYNPKYYLGLKENIEIINEKFPDFLTFVWLGNNVDKEKLKEVVSTINLSNVRFLEVNIDDCKLTVFRFLSIDITGVEVVFSRDTDSRINERDEWCIRKFIESPQLIHTIRDHKGHFDKMMGGLSGIKKQFITEHFGSSLKLQVDNYLASLTQPFYTYDQHFLNVLIYSKHKDLLLLHSTKNIYDDPNYEEIPLEVNKENFCGQVIDYDENGEKKFVYEYQSYELSE